MTAGLPTESEAIGLAPRSTRHGVQGILERPVMLRIIEKT